jgi:Fe-S cluster assembly protein SufB
MPKNNESQKNKEVRDFLEKGYSAGFSSKLNMEIAPKGLNEKIIRFISNKNNDPKWLTGWRLKAYQNWQKMESPHWAVFDYEKIDYNDIYYYAAPKQKKDKPKSLEEVDTNILNIYKKLGVPLKEQEILTGVAVDAVLDSTSVATTYQAKLEELGIIFCPISQASKKHPRLLRKYLGSIVPPDDNFFAALNSAAFGDGTFIYIPKGVKCPIELSTYFRLNTEKVGQFERTLIIADEDSYVSYLEGCTAPMYDENQLHAAVVELIALKGAEIKYATVQNWYPGSKEGKGGIYNFVTKRAIAHKNAKISWTQLETGSALTWKYPSVILKGDNSVGEFYSVAITNNMQRADTGTKMIHLGKNTHSKIISKGISAGKSANAYRGLVKARKSAENSKNFTKCDSLLIGNECSAHTIPVMEISNTSSTIEHEATTSKIDEEKMFYLNQRGIDEDKAISLIVNGFCKDILAKLPLEFAIEAKALIEISLEGSVG